MMTSGTWRTGEDGSSESRPVRIPALVVIALSLFIWWIGYPSAVSDVVGDGPTALLRRQSEGYVMIALLLGFWAWLAPSGHPSSPGTVIPRNPITSTARWFGWFGALIVATLLMSATDMLPNALVTLKEAAVGVIVVSWYLSWSRGLGPGSETWANGASVQNVATRVSYYSVMVAVIIFTYVGVFDVLGDDVSTWFRENSEAFGAVLLIPMYFDLVAPRRSVLSRVLWYGGIVVLLILAQISGYPDAIQPYAGWLNEMTEAFIAAIAISAFFDLLAPRTK